MLAVPDFPMAVCAKIAFYCNNLLVFFLQANKTEFIEKPLQALETIDINDFFEKFKGFDFKKMEHKDEYIRISGDLNSFVRGKTGHYPQFRDVCL